MSGQWQRMTVVAELSVTAYVVAKLKSECKRHMFKLPL